MSLGWRFYHGMTPLALALMLALAGICSFASFGGWGLFVYWLAGATIAAGRYGLTLGSNFQGMVMFAGFGPAALCLCYLNRGLAELLAVNYSAPKTGGGG